MGFKNTLLITPVQTEEELSLISRLYQQANPHATLNDITKWTKKTWKNSDNIILKADINNELVGAISIEITKNKALIDDLAIKTNHQKKEIGRKLWQFCEKELKLRGINIITGRVHYKRAEIIPFCYKNGFRLNKVVKDGFGPGEDYIEVIKDLRAI
ncbi:MAG: GNAT family N-acetyltransferase [Promethearchaeota archaeon]|jgi:ribosomal protein S18 acetylase RimI-like enzyme